MIRALIVDDDIPTTEVICERVNWQSFGVDEVYTAHNINDAKKVIIQHGPQLVLCDIEMPMGTGLDLIRWVRGEELGSKFVFITCHENFSYATQAMDYEAVAYITKPFQLHKTQAAISKAVEAIRREQHAKKRDSQWQESQESVEELFWRDLLYGFMSSSRESLTTEIANRGLDFSPDDTFGVMLVSVGRAQLEDGDWSNNTAKYALRNLSSEVILGRLDTSRAFAYSHNHYYLVLLVWEKPQTVEQIQSNSKQLVQTLAEYFHAKASCYISGEVPLEELAKMRERLELSNLENVAGYSCVLLGEDRAAPVNDGVQALDSELLRTLLAEDRGVAAIDAVRIHLESLSAAGNLNRDLLRNFLQDYTQIVYALLYEKDIQARKLFDDWSSQALVQTSENSVFDAIRWISHLTTTSLRYIKESQQSATIMDKIVSYIKENYMYDISRDDIAAHVYLTPNYVSKIFKATQGCYLKDFINDVRITHAKELLRSTQMSVSEVAAATGFDNFSYFSTLFRKATGASPSNYRKGL